MNNPTTSPARHPGIALAIIGSNLTAIAAELLASTAQYDQVLAITRRKTHTALPIAMDGDAWAQPLEHLGWFGAARQIRAVEDQLTTLTCGRTYDCFLHHSKDPLSQILASHPLCGKFFYLEEGFTAHIGDSFGRPKPRPTKKLIGKLKSAIYYGRRIDKYRDFFDLRATNYGGAYALSRGAFQGFPGRVQLPTENIAFTLPVPAEVVVFLDSQYFLGNCRIEDYCIALTDCLTEIIDLRVSVAIKFHPGETDAGRKADIMRAVAALPHVSHLSELPSDFIGERMAFSDTTKVVVGTSALGLYLGERGFQTFSFAARLASVSARYARVLAQIPPEFLRVCRSA